MSVRNLHTRLAGPLMAVLAVLVTLGAIEATLRLSLTEREQATLGRPGLDLEDSDRLRWRDRVHTQHPTGMAFDVYDPLLGWRPRANLRRERTVAGERILVSTNGAALRGPVEVPMERTPGTPRIALFGCSQTFGGLIDDTRTVSARLADLVPGAEVLNFAVHGYGTDQMLLRWESEGVHWKPDVVVLAFAYYHLSRNAVAFRYFEKPRFALRDADGELELIGVPIPPPDVVVAQPGPAPLPGLDHLVLLRWLWERHLRLDEDAMFTPTSDPWRLTAAILTRFAASVHAQGARFVIANVGDAALDVGDATAELATTLGAEWIDVRPRLAELRSAGVALRVPGDPHWNARGHDEIAHHLLRALCDGDATVGARCPSLPPAVPATAGTRARRSGSGS
ncbi:MAG: hypothetical protein KIT14_19135 [bacterium]|nr:hypothetical protein [bacterium]